MKRWEDFSQEVDPPIEEEEVKAPVEEVEAIVDQEERGRQVKAVLKAQPRLNSKIMSIELAQRVKQVTSM